MYTQKLFSPGRMKLNGNPFKKNSFDTTAGEKRTA
jgi:hypothetical protein